jgi:hypothetical protein
MHCESGSPLGTGSVGVGWSRRGADTRYLGLYACCLPAKKAVLRLTHKLLADLVGWMPVQLPAAVAPSPATHMKL